MKCALRWSVVLMLATTLVAQTAAKKPVKKAAAAVPAVTAEDVQALKDALAAQQRQIQQLQQQLQQTNTSLQQSQQQAQQAQSAATEAQQKAADAASAGTQQNDTVVKLSSDMADVKTTLTNTAVNTQEDQKRFSALEGAVGHLKMSGDLRLRFEPFFGGGTDAAPAQDRFRERYRLRFNINSKIDNDFAIGLTLSSGDLGDPISTNSTETGFYTRKPIAIDKAFGTYTPHGLKPFSVTAGKFAYTWLRTELVWDNDLNPEGASEQLSWNFKNKFINHFAVIGFETPLWEVGSGVDSYMTGGQVQTGWDLGPKLKLTADVAYYDFANADTIAQNQGQAPANGFATTGITNGGGGSFGFGAQGPTNVFGVIAGKRVFASKYGIVDTIARLDIDTGWKKFPIYVLGDFAQNTRACSNLGTFAAAGVAVPTCDPHARHAYWGEFQLGQTKNKGDMRFGYTFNRTERDAVLSAFNFSDMKQATNVLQHRLEAFYQLYPHVTVGATGLIGRQIVNASAPVEERWLKRWQFDTIYSF